MWCDICDECCVNRLGIEGIDWLARALKDRYPTSQPLPYAYPVPEGGVQLEWSMKRREISLEVDFDAKSGEWHSLDLETDQEEYRSLNLDGQEGWSWLVDRLKGLKGATA